MKGATSIQERLWELRKDKGLNLEELSKLTGISKSALGSYEKEDFKEINHGNLITLADFYGVSVDYLLCRTENREQINTSLTELHLNDEMVALLKSGRINNRLLCELATHKDFIKFLADIEIYVDGIATMQIQNLNALVDTVRHEIIERYRPGEDDPHLKVLQAAHISDDEYFSHMVLDDLNLIIRDIREAHKKDSESAPQTTVANELKENLEELSELTGISKSALGSYEKEDYKEINHGNLFTLADFYGVSVDYLLCRTENKEQINTPLTELHLNDEMVALLKSGRINNRLLCELATHKDFIKFLADLEIYVDGIATMQIQNLNALVDTVRHEIIERYRPGEDDPHLKVLQAAHISDDEYFSHMVLDDLNLIIRDIREAHKKDSESAPQTTVADELKENLEAVENFKGSRDEKLVVLYCKQLGINYKNLSDEEFRWLIRILKKSKKMGTPISQRKKR